MGDNKKSKGEKRLREESSIGSSKHSPPRNTTRPSSSRPPLDPSGSERQPRNTTRPSSSRPPLDPSGSEPPDPEQRPESPKEPDVTPQRRRVDPSAMIPQPEELQLPRSRRLPAPNPPSSSESPYAGHRVPQRSTTAPRGHGRGQQLPRIQELNQTLLQLRSTGGGRGYVQAPRPGIIAPSDFERLPQGQNPEAEPLGNTETEAYKERFESAKKEIEQQKARLKMEQEASKKEKEQQKQRESDAREEAKRQKQRIPVEERAAEKRKKKREEAQRRRARKEAELQKPGMTEEEKWEAGGERRKLNRGYSHTYRNKKKQKDEEEGKGKDKDKKGKGGRKPREK